MYKNSSEDSILLERQVQPLFENTMLSGLANICAAAILYSLLTEPLLSIFPCLGVVVFSLLRIGVAKHYLKTHRFKLQTYLNAHILLTMMMGIMWGVFEFIQYQVETLEIRNIVLLLNIALIAGSISTLSTYRNTYLAYVIPQSIGIFYLLSLYDTETAIYLQVAFTVFMGFMISSSLNMTRIHKNSVKLIRYNENLISDLNDEIRVRESVQVELEESKVGLENKVKKRTEDLIDTNVHLERVITKKEKAEQSLQYLAYHDELTGLPNRNLLVDRINQSIKISLRDNQQMAILFLDLDRFKNINDSLGHNVGDEVLKEIPIRLYSVLRSHDTISRNGGDEFVVVLEKLKDANEAVYVAKKIIACLAETFNVLSHTIHIGASIGISLYPDDGDTPLVLLRNADTAMYKAKKSGGKQLQFYDESMSHQLRDRLELESELHNALAENEFYMVYQPQVNCITGETTGFESLIRWKNKKLGEINPDRFVPILEETGLIYSVGEWVVAEVIAFVKTINDDKKVFSINLSALQCTRLDFLTFVSEQISMRDVKPSQIEFEITESILIKDFEKTKIFLNELHSMGCSIALDDFGTGYTSMNYLAQLPIDVIKIDKIFIKHIHQTENLKSIVKAIIMMSKSLNINNIFEGVETQNELDVIKEINGSIVQGYYYSKPLEESKVIDWLTP
ncbi:MAG: EAL domain-containing protein [Proteobacteria bacterium]|nr:EAL domain-containing protein [Pseudomonadota bacterium]